MLLKKQENETQIRTMYSSSNICAAIYEKSNKDLTIIFNNGGQYKYIGVSETDYMRFELADSQGIIFNSHIKKYSFDKLDKIDVQFLLTEVAEIKDKEVNLKKKYHEDKLFESIRQFIAIHETTNNFNIDTLKTAISTYETSLNQA